MIPRYIRVTAAIAPVLREPRAAATQENQILFGHDAEVIGREGHWYRVRGGDGYEGWLHEGYCEPGEATAWSWGSEATLSLGATISDEQGKEFALPLGAVVRGRVIAGGAATRAERGSMFPPDGESIVGSAKRFFAGTWYQWGGITPWGADCSGMVQTVFALHGVKLLRDAWQQATQGVLVEGGMEAVVPADLAFFSDRDDGHITHVALVASPGSLVHQAIGRGGHRVESLAAPDDYCRGLMRRFRFARRVLATGSS